MPTLIRLLVFLLVLAGLAFGGMVALTATVDPGQKEIRVRIPARDLVMTNEEGESLNLRDQLPSPTTTTPDPAAAPPSTAPVGGSPE